MKEQPFQLPSRHSPELVLEVCDLTFHDNGPYSFAAGAGECVGISGVSGVGKTQLLRAIADLISYSGTIRLNDVDSRDVPPTDWRKKVGMVPADSCWWYDRVGDHFSTQYNPQLLDDLVVQLGFATDVLKWEVRRLSSGERQRLAFARAAILEPVILLLDEPTSALDSSATELVEKIVQSLQVKKHTTVIWVSHDMAQLRRVADRVMNISKRCLQQTYAE